MNSEMSSGKKTTGRKKIAIEKIEIPKYLQVTFSKRTNGIFKKATELAFLCGAHPFVLIFSPGGKPHVFVHPSVDIIVNQFLNDGIDGLAHRYNELNDQVEVVEKQRCEKKNRNTKSPQYSLITCTLEELNCSKIENLKTIFEQAMQNAKNQILVFYRPSSSISMPNNQPAGYSDSLAPDAMVPYESTESTELVMETSSSFIVPNRNVPAHKVTNFDELISSSLPNPSSNHDGMVNLSIPNSGAIIHEAVLKEAIAASPPFVPPKINGFGMLNQFPRSEEDDAEKLYKDSFSHMNQS
uniref:MADS-box protein AGL68 n=1 Tax=Aquilegia coerulea TaxID=218851 RepID=K7XJ80_AQUCA|nr:MADS-box protein AGL68 [Aquilegia coerulea]